MPTPDHPTEADREQADLIAWSMALEGRALTEAARQRLLDSIAAARPVGGEEQ